MKRNIMPLLGSLMGITLILWAININGDLVNFVDMSSIIITVVGSFCALLISFPFQTLMNVPRILKVLLIQPKDEKQNLVILFDELSRKARKDGLLALEDNVEEIDNDFLNMGLQMVIDGVEPETINDILNLRLETMEARHRTGQDVFEQWGELSPAFGMLGTLIGLIVMLSKLDDPSAIGPGMATALITTFYGSLMANLVFLPIASNLRLQTDEEMYIGQMIIDGVLGIQAGSNPRILEEKLITYLSQKERRRLEEDKVLQEAEAYE